VKTLVVIVVYNRLENIRTWLRCWKQCDQTGAELVVIHNVDTPAESTPFKKLCDENGIKYIMRRNIGQDIAAFQDVCRERLIGFDNGWEHIIWITDDVIPIHKTFVKAFLDGMENQTTGAVAHEVSDVVRRHIRTIGFCISKSVSQRLTFPADPITSRDQCLAFEHRGNCLFEQILGLNLCVRMVSGTVATSPLWEWENVSWGHPNRQEEFNAMFPLNEKVTFICPIYNTFPEIISSLKNQTHENWELYLIHDGPNETGISDLVKSIKDPRIHYTEQEKRVGNWGHYYRQWYLTLIRDGKIAPDTFAIVITNGDNHHTPNFCKDLLAPLVRNGAVASYCSKMVHSYVNWGILDCRLERGYIDCAGVMIKKDAACSVGWRDTESHSADWFYFQDIINKYGADKWVKVEGCMLTHN
jgi:hypothetical protein